MLDKVPIRTPPGAQLIACPPKQQARPADPCALVIFGATGDLTKRLVVPALYNLSRSKVLPEQFALIGVARSDGTAESWRERLHDMLKSFVGRAERSSTPTTSTKTRGRGLPTRWRTSRAT